MTKGDERELRLKISLIGATPPIWRRVVVREAITLADLHRTIQVAMGWLDCHLYEFEVKGKRYTTIDPDTPDDALASDAVTLRDLRLRRRGTKFRYDYDFGDNWRHWIEVERIDPIDPDATYPRCLAGRRACPPEDSGGLYGYARILDIVSDPQHPEHDEFAEWLPPGFDAAHFDLQEVNALLSQAFGESATRAVVSLQDVVIAMSDQGQEWESFLDPNSGEIITVTDEDLMALETSDPDLLPDWQREMLPRIREVVETGRCLRLPDSFEIHEWAIMERFCHSLDESSARGELLDSIHGGGAFRVFRRTLDRLELREQWYAYRQDEFEQMAREWLEANRIPYT